MSKSVAQDRVSEFAAGLKERSDSREVVEFDVNGFFGPGKKPLPKVGIRVPTKAEQDRAWIQSKAYVESLCKDVESAKNDEELLQDARAAFIVNEVCRDVNDPKYPAFPSGKYLCENASTDQIAMLLNLHTEVRANSNGNKLVLSDSDVFVMAADCVVAAKEGDVPEASLAMYSREFLARAFVILSKKLDSLAALPKADSLDEDVPTQD
jgi:hypothetical protein